MVSYTKRQQSSSSSFRNNLKENQNKKSGTNLHYIYYCVHFHDTVKYSESLGETPILLGPLETAKVQRLRLALDTGTNRVGVPFPLSEDGIDPIFKKLYLLVI
jgi:hypothetical protein